MVKLAICHALGARVAGRCSLPSSVRKRICSFLFPSDCYAVALYINSHMRAILIDWLIDVSRRYKCHEVTIHSAVSLIDAFMTANPTLPRNRFQLLGISALYVASKIDWDPEEWGPSECAYITAHAYTVNDVLQMEENLLPFVAKAWPGWGALHFLAYFAGEISLPERYFHLAHMVLDQSLLAYKLSRHSPGLLAAGACLLAGRFANIQEGLVRFGKWPCGGLAEVCRRSQNEVRHVAKELCSSLEPSFCTMSTGTLQAVRKKFSLKKHLNAAALVEQEHQKIHACGIP